MASNRVSDIGSPLRNRQPNAKDSDDSINRNASQRRKSRNRETVNIARTDLNDLYAEMRQFRSEVDRVRNRTHWLDTEHRHNKDNFSDEELDIYN